MKGFLVIREFRLKPKAYKFEGNLKDLILTACELKRKNSRITQVLFISEAERRALLKYLRSEDLFQAWLRLNTGILFDHLDYYHKHKKSYKKTYKVIYSFDILVSNKICPGSDTHEILYYADVDFDLNFVRLTKQYSIKDVVKTKLSLDELEKLNICEFLDAVRK